MFSIFVFDGRRRLKGVGWKGGNAFFSRQTCKKARNKPLQHELSKRYYFFSCRVLNTQQLRQSVSTIEGPTEGNAFGNQLQRTKELKKMTQTIQEFRQPIGNGKRQGETRKEDAPSG